MSVWAPYEPTGSAPWDLKRVVHLHRRAVFGGCWNEIQRDLKADPQEAVTRLLNGTCRLSDPSAELDKAATADASVSRESFEHLAGIIGNSAVDSGSAERLKAWWLYRCLFSPDPLRERLTLMWHNHFATSNLKVNDLRLMKQQNETMRTHAAGEFGALLREMSHDPALLEWLDAPVNRVGMPNENLAREMMELFSLGIGNYTETDIREAARALTGWTVRQGKFRNLDGAHDNESKAILGQTGTWDGDDFVRIILEQPCCSRRIAWRLTAEFCGEKVVDEQSLDELAAGLRDHQLNIGWGVETILRSRLFFSEANINSRVSDPVSFLMMPLRALEFGRHPPSTLVLAEWISRMGQDLFYPPNVGGWNGGRAWLSTRTVVARSNYITALTEGRLASPAEPPPLSEVLAQMAPAGDARESVRALSELLFGSADPARVQAVAEQVSATVDPSLMTNSAAQLLLTAPQAYLH